jgi:hypothetical protein
MLRREITDSDEPQQAFEGNCAVDYFCERVGTQLSEAREP